MAGIELCAQYKLDSRPPSNRRQFYLPEPDCMYRILVMIKDVLDSSCVSERVHDATVHRYLGDYTRRLWRKEMDKGFNIDDLLGYRSFAKSIASDRSGEFIQKWITLVPLFYETPPELIVVISEKYFTIIPRVTVEGDIPTSDLPFIDLKPGNYALWEKGIIKDHRLAALARLEGKLLGELRRGQGKLLLLLVKQHKCVCMSYCRCAGECTGNPERACPCSERQLRIMLSRNRKGPGRFKFATRTNTMGRAFFESLTFLKRSARDEHLVTELRDATEVFEMEILKERSAMIFR